MVDCYRLAGERRPVIPTAWRHQSVYDRLPRPDLEWSGLTLQNWLLAREASHVPDRALGLKAVVVLPFEQPVGALVHSQSVVAIGLVRQRGAVHQHLLHNGYKLRSDILLACSVFRHLPKRMFTTYRWGPGEGGVRGERRGMAGTPAHSGRFAALMLLYDSRPANASQPLMRPLLKPAQARGFIHTQTYNGMWTTYGSYWWDDRMAPHPPTPSLSVWRDLRIPIPRCLPQVLLRKIESELKNPGRESAWGSKF